MWKRRAIFGLFHGLWSVGHVFAAGANPRSWTPPPAMSPALTVRGGEYDTKMCNIRIDGASDICEGDNFRLLVSTKIPKYEKYDRPSPEA